MFIIFKKGNKVSKKNIMLEKYQKIENLSVSKTLYDFINKEAIPGTDINKQNFSEGSLKDNISKQYN